MKISPISDHDFPAAGLQYIMTIIWISRQMDARQDRNNFIGIRRVLCNPVPDLFFPRSPAAAQPFQSQQHLIGTVLQSRPGLFKAGYRYVQHRQIMIASSG